MSLHRLTGLVAPAALSIWLAAGCTRPAPPSETAPAAATRPGAFPREQLIEDARELAGIIEETHPDPYSGGGGRIAFHRRLRQALNAIPDEGMTGDEFCRLLRPFVAGVGDAHTNLVRGYRVDHDRPGGVPLRLKVVEESLGSPAASTGPSATPDCTLQTVPTSRWRRSARGAQCRWSRATTTSRGPTWTARRSPGGQGRWASRRW